jgi:DNA polymerase-3 subunit delta
MTLHLLTGDDESLLRSATGELIHELVGDGDRSMMVDDFDGDDYELRSVVDAAQTPPFLSERRIVVARTIGRFGSDELGPLLEYCERPLETTDLVLVGGGGRIPKQLADLAKREGTVTSTAAPSRARERADWIADHVARAGVRLDPRATELLADRLGEDVGRLNGILATLASTFGPGRTLRADDVEPFLGEAGGVPPWDFTDAIDRGDTTAALTMLGRMVHGGGRHPLQVMSILHNHYAGLAKLDGVDARTEQEAMAATGIKSPFPAKKAMQNYRRLGRDNVKRAIDLLAAADLDLRGVRDLPDEVIMQVLVARLSKLR